MTTSARSCGMEIVDSERAERVFSLVTGVTKIVTSRRLICSACLQDGCRLSAPSDTMDRPTAVRKALPDPGSSRVGTGRVGRHRFYESRTLGNPAQTHEAPTCSQPASKAAGEGSNHERGCEAMSHGHRECIRGGGLTATPGDVSARENGLTRGAR